MLLRGEGCGDDDKVVSGQEEESCCLSAGQDEGGGGDDDGARGMSHGSRMSDKHARCQGSSLHESTTNLGTAQMRQSTTVRYSTDEGEFDGSRVHYSRIEGPGQISAECKNGKTSFMGSTHVEGETGRSEDTLGVLTLNKVHLRGMKSGTGDENLTKYTNSNTPRRKPRRS